MAGSDQNQIVDSCVNCFIRCGYETAQSIIENCERINIDSDGLNLIETNVPFEVVSAIYQTIRDMRKPPSTSEVVKWIINVFHMTFEVLGILL